MDPRVIEESDLREPNTYESIAVVRVSREELAERGIELMPPPEGRPWDEAGPIEEAFVETATGEQPLLIWHLVFEQTRTRWPLELRAPKSTPDPQAFVTATLKALSLPPERAEWIVSAEHWPP